MTDHIVDIRDDGASLTHPDAACREDCPVARAVLAEGSRLRSRCRGRHPCSVDASGRLVITCDQHVWDDGDRLDPSLLPHPMTRSINRLSGDADHPALLRDSFHPWQ